MTLDELVIELQKVQAEGHGSLPVRFWNSRCDVDIKEVYVYDKQGYDPENTNFDGTPAEVYLW